MTFKDPKTGERIPLTSDHPYFLSEGYMKDRWFVGTPDDVVNDIVTWQQKLKLDVLFFHPKMPGMPLKQAVDELHRVTGQVMPRLRERLAAPNR